MRRIKNLRRKGKNWQAYVRVNGVLETETFAIDHPLGKIRAWIATQKARNTGRRGKAGSFAADIATFLAKPEIAAQKYVGQLARHLSLWETELGSQRIRCTIERDDVEAVIQRWLATFAEPTVYHRRSALLQLFTVLDGADAANPVKGTTCPKAWIPADHSVSFSTLAAIVEAMPDWHYPKKGIKRASIAKVVGRVIVTVGLRPVDLLKIRRQDIDWNAETLRWPASEKGKGTAARTVPLTTEGLAALRAFDAAGAYQGFTVEAVSHSFKRAARRIDGDDTCVHLYSGRHAIGADLYRTTGDLATVGRMLNHAPNSHATPQYAQGANADVDRAAVRALSLARQVQPPSQKLPEMLPAASNVKPLKRLRR